MKNWHIPKFDNYIEYVFYFKDTPTNSKECYKQLGALNDLDKKYWNQYKNDFISYHYSKRRERLVKMFWAFKKMETA